MKRQATERRKKEKRLSRKIGECIVALDKLEWRIERAVTGEQRRLAEHNWNAVQKIRQRLWDASCRLEVIK